MRSFSCLIFCFLVQCLCSRSKYIPYVKSVTDCSGNTFQCKEFPVSHVVFILSAHVANDSSGEIVLNKDHINLCPTHLRTLVINGPIIGIENDTFQNDSSIDELRLSADLVEVKKSYFENLHRLRKLDLKLPLTEKIETGVFDDLKVVKLEVNSINEFNVGLFNGTPLIYLELKGNFSRIQDNALSDMTSIATLKIYNSGLTTFNARKWLHNSNSVQMLYLNSNKITSLNEDSFFGLTELNFINLSNNKIEALGDNTFSTNPNLETILLADNRLTYIESRIFSEAPLKKLENLDLGFNFLHQSSVELFDKMPNLKKMSILGNPFKCDCLNRLQMELKKVGIEEHYCRGFNEAHFPVCWLPNKGDESCESEGSTDEVKYYKEQFNSTILPRLLWICQIHL